MFALGCFATVSSSTSPRITTRTKSCCRVGSWAACHIERCSGKHLAVPTMRFEGVEAWWKEDGIRTHFQRQDQTPKTGHHTPLFTWMASLGAGCQRGRRILISVTRTNQVVPVSKSGEVGRYAETLAGSRTLRRDKECRSGRKAPLAPNTKVPRRGKVHPERSRITALPFASLCPSLDHDRAIHSPHPHPGVL